VRGPSLYLSTNKRVLRWVRKKKQCVDANKIPTPTTNRVVLQEAGSRRRRTKEREADIF
jgi:hypothetical protein